ncbi:hypothetical protein M0804_009000 [Polistes exclamans]|nr:hypothetical protein M0804_009000 [Polistes exclamans]
MPGQTKTGQFYTTLEKTICNLIATLAKVEHSDTLKKVRTEKIFNINVHNEITIEAKKEHPRIPTLPNLKFVKRDKRTSKTYEHEQDF